MRLVDDWKEAYKWISMNSMLATVTVSGAWVAIPDDLRASMPHDIVHWVAISLLMLGIAGRLVKQG